MKTTQDGKPYCQLTEMEHGDLIEVHPKLWRVISMMAKSGATGKVELNFNGGNLTGAVVMGVEVDELLKAPRNGNGRH